MSTHPAVQRAAVRVARAAHRRAQTAINEETHPTEVAHVFQVAPIIILELAESAIHLEEGKQLRLSDQVRWWDSNFGVKKGDPMVVVELSDLTWVALAVMSDAPVAGGAKGLKPPAGGFGQGGDFEDLDSASLSGLLTATVNIPSVGVSGSVSGTDSGGDTFSAGLSGGATAAASGVTVNLTWHQSIVAKMPVYDKSGVLLGYVPVFSDLPA